MTYLVLSPKISSTYPVHHQSLGRAIPTFSSLKSLEVVEENSEIIVFYDEMLNVQKMLDLEALLNLSYHVIVNNSDDLEMLSPIFKTTLLDYSQIDAQLIRAIQLNDKNAIASMERSSTDKKSVAFRQSYLQEVQRMAGPGSTDAVNELATKFLNLWSTHSHLGQLHSALSAKDKENTIALFHLRRSLASIKKEMVDFLQTFVGLQNKYRSSIASSIARENLKIHLPQHITSLVLKNYGMPNTFDFVQTLYDTLTVSYDRHTKVVYIVDPNGIDINLLPDYYLTIDSKVQTADLMDYDYIALVSDVKVPLELLLSTSQVNTLIVIDARKEPDRLFLGETLSLNLVPDVHTMTKLLLPEEQTISPTSKTKYYLDEDAVDNINQFGKRNSRIVGFVVNTLLDHQL